MIMIMEIIMITNMMVVVALKLVKLVGINIPLFHIKEAIAQVLVVRFGQVLVILAVGLGNLIF